MVSLSQKCHHVVVMDGTWHSRRELGGNEGDVIYFCFASLFYLCLQCKFFENRMLRLLECALSSFAWPYSKKPMIQARLAIADAYVRMVV